jgi:hypothetical protein
VPDSTRTQRAEFDYADFSAILPPTMISMLLFEQDRDHLRDDIFHIEEARSAWRGVDQGPGRDERLPASSRTGSDDMFTDLHAEILDDDGNARQLTDSNSPSS